MSTEQHEQLKALLDRALELDPDRWEAFAAEACAADEALRGQLLALLRSFRESPDILERSPVRGLDEKREQRDALERLGAQIGCYRIEELVGMGGMGVVYRAVRVDGAFEQTVAVKFVRWSSGDDLAKRFRQERTALAKLNHPGITSLLDAGVDERGTPYLVMEYVAGRPIDVYCAENRLGLEERVRLIIDVCGILSHAHRHLVVHRDLKPSNILIDAEGRPRLLDFGIAKLLDIDAHRQGGATVFAQPLTPEYASPEQFKGEAITTSTDVYGVGVVLYELLTGRRPFRESDSGSFYNFSQTVCEAPPPRPSTVVRRLPDDARPVGLENEGERWSRALRGDLDAIIERALRKEPEQRYATVDQFADDLRRWLDGLPVLARKGTFSYRASKMVRRHKGTTVAASVALFFLVFGGAGMTYQAWRVARQRDATEIARRQARAEAERAEDEAEVSRRVTEMLIDMFKVADPEEGPGIDMSARELLDRGARTIRASLENEPRVRATLLDALGGVYYNLGEYTQAEALLREALELRRAEYGVDSLEAATTLNDLGLVCQQQGRLNEALGMFQQALDIRRRHLQNDSPEVLQSRHNLAFIYQGMGRLDEAEKILQDVLAGRIERFGLESSEVITTMNNLGMVRLMQGRHDEARHTFEELLPLTERVYGENHAQVALVINNLAFAAHSAGDLDEAESFYRRALEMRRSLRPVNHVQIARLCNNLGGLAFDRGRFDEAADWFNQALSAFQEGKQTAESPIVFQIRRNLGRALLAGGDAVRALPLLDSAYQNLSRTLGAAHAQTVQAALLRSDALLATGDARGAEDAARSIVESIDPEQRGRAWCEAQLRLARALLARRENAEAEACAGAVLERAASLDPPAEDLLEKARKILGGPGSSAGSAGG